MDITPKGILFIILGFQPSSPPFFFFKSTRLQMLASFKCHSLHKGTSNPPLGTRPVQAVHVHDYGFGREFPHPLLLLIFFWGGWVNYIIWSLLARLLKCEQSWTEETSWEGKDNWSLLCVCACVPVYMCYRIAIPLDLSFFFFFNIYKLHWRG